MANIVGGSVVWDLDIDNKSFNSKISDAKASIDKLAKEGDKKISSMSKSISKSLNDSAQASKVFATGLLGIGTALIGAGGLGLKTAGEFETLQIALETVTGSSEKASDAMKTIKQVAKDSPFFEVGTLAQFTQLMAASGQEIDEAVKSGIKFGDVAAAFGKGNAQMKMLGNTLSQVIGKGRADTVDFKEIVNQGWVSVRKDVALAMGVSMAEFENLLSSGKITYEELSKAAEKFAGSAEKQSKTLSALWSRFSETVSTTFASIVVDTGLFDVFKNGLDQVIIAIESIDVAKLSTFIGIMVDNFPIVAGAITGALIPAFISWGIAMIPVIAGLIASTIALLPWIVVGALVGLAIKLLVDNFNFLKESLFNFLTFVSTLPDLVLGFFMQLPTNIAFALGFALATIIQWGVNTWNYLRTNVPIWIANLVAWFRQLPGKMFVALSQLGPALRDAFVRGWSAIVTEVSSWPGKLKQWGKNIAEAFVNGVKDGLNSLKNAFIDGFNRAKDSIQGKSPPKEGPFKNIDKWGENIGMAWVEGMSSAISQMNSILMPTLGNVAPAFEVDQSFAQSSRGQIASNSGSGGQNIVVNVGQINDNRDIEMIGREIGFNIAVLPQ